jgi:hypothetical protein
VTSLTLVGAGFLLAAGGASRLLGLVLLLVGVDRFWLDVATAAFLLAAAEAAGGAFRFLVFELVLAVVGPLFIGVYRNGAS